VKMCNLRNQNIAFLKSAPSKKPMFSVDPYDCHTKVHNYQAPPWRFWPATSPSRPGFLPLSGQEPRMNSSRGMAGDWKHHFQVVSMLVCINR
jgi:hypothetical protein